MWNEFALLLGVAVCGLAILFFKKDIPLGKLKDLYTDMNSRVFSWQGLEVHLKDEGKGTPVLLLHGTSSSLHTWDPLVEELKSQYRMIRLDLPGFGLTGPHPEGNYSIENYRLLICNLTDHLSLDQFLIGGNSWGGMLAWDYAAHHQDKVEGLILMGADGFGMEKVPLRLKLARSASYRWLVPLVISKWMMKKGLEEVVYFYSLISPEMVDRYYHMALRQGNRQALMDFMSERKPPERALLKQIEIPVLIIWGRHDCLYPVEQAFRFQEYLPQGRVVIVEEAAHLPMEEAPEVCGRIIRTFIDQIHIRPKRSYPAQADGSGQIPMGV